MKAFFESRDDTLFVGKMTSYPYPLHVHESVELVCLLSGGCAMQIGGEIYRLKPGDFAVIFPLVPHSYNSIDEGTDGFVAFFSADEFTEFVHTLDTLLPENPVIGMGELNHAVYLLVDELLRTAQEESSPLRLAYLHLLTAHVLSAMRLSPARSYPDRSLGARAIRYIYEHACEKLTLESAARGLGISKSHLSHLFAQQYHVNFRHFINSVRIGKAITLLRKPKMTISQICYACGYENMRTFQRAFLRETGELPSEYMQRIRRMSWEEPERDGAPQ